MIKRFLIVGAICATILFVQDPKIKAENIATTPSTTIQQPKSFHFQLQKTKFNKLKELNVDMIVVDIDDSNLTSDQISQLKNTGKKVISYLSIGEAENYRPYWQTGWKIGSPSFLDKENPDWPGNFKVKYRDADWQKIIINRLKEISDRGYDGAYLDIIDAYYYYQEQGRSNAAQEMIDFIKKLRENSKQGFLLIPQNAVELYEHTDYKSLIDGLGVESTWYENNKKQNQKDHTDFVLKYLRMAKNDGKFILSIDYPTNNKKICDYYNKCNAEGFACLVTNLALSLKEPKICK